MLAEDIKTVDDFVGDAFGKVSVVAAFGRIKTALAELGTAPNTGSPKLPSSTEVWNHVCEYSPALRTVEQVEADRRVAKLVYGFIYRQLRAGA